MLNISINRETGQARLAQSTAIKAGGMVPVRVEFSTSPGVGPVIELAIVQQNTDRSILAYVDSFAAENSTVYLATLNLNDVRTTAFMEGKSLASVDVEVVVTSGGSGRMIYPNIAATLQRAALTGPDASLGGPANPVVQMIDDVPSHLTDFFMFPGGVAPLTGMYQATDENFLYTFKAGWTAWKRAPLAAWE